MAVPDKISAEDPNMNKLRDAVDKVDSQIVALLNKRGALAQEIAKSKLESGENHIYKPEREVSLLKNLLEQNVGPLTERQIRLIYSEIISACRALQQPLKIAFLGPVGTFTEAATYKHFGHEVEFAATDTIDGIFREVGSGTSNYGVVPVENSTEGGVNHTLDMLIQTELQICGEIQLPVHHCLLSQNSNLDTISSLFAHPQALAQCRQWLDANLPRVERVAVSSNAEGARLAAEIKSAAAIAGRLAAEHYKLSVQVSNIEDDPENRTRFLVIGQHDVEATGDDKTSLLISFQDKPGALYKILQTFADENINMNRIESRPSRLRSWHYMFFIDVDGHRQQENLKRVIDTLNSSSAYCRILGSYPKAAP